MFARYALGFLAAATLGLVVFSVQPSARRDALLQSLRATTTTTINTTVTVGSCIIDGGACAANTDCCSMSCGAGSCLSSAPSCRIHGQSCLPGANQCCPNHACMNLFDDVFSCIFTGTPICSPDLVSCDANADCCGGSCVAGVCLTSFPVPVPVPIPPSPPPSSSALSVPPLPCDCVATQSLLQLFTFGLLGDTTCVPPPGCGTGGGSSSAGGTIGGSSSAGLADADTSLEKTLVPFAAGVPVVGGEVAFRLTAQNRTFDPVTGVTVVDAAVPGLEFLRAEGAPCVFGSSGVTCELGTLAAAESTTFRLVYRLRPRVGDACVVRNSAVSFADNHDPTPSNNFANAEFNAYCITGGASSSSPADVPPPPPPLTHACCQLLVTQIGTVQGSRCVGARDAAACLATIETSVSATQKVGDAAFRSGLQCGSFSCGELFTERACCLSTSCSLRKVHECLAAGGVPQTTNTCSPNRCSANGGASSSIAPTPAASSAAPINDLTVEKKLVGPLTRNPGDEVRYDVTILNHGSETALVTLSDFPPNGLTLTGMPAACSGDIRLITCTLSVPPEDMTATFLFRVNEPVQPCTTRALIGQNRAFVQSDRTFDRDAFNNISDAPMLSVPCGEPAEEEEEGGGGEETGTDGEGSEDTGGGGGEGTQLYCCSDTARGNACVAMGPGIACDSGTLTSSPLCDNRCSIVEIESPPRCEVCPANAFSARECGMSGCRWVPSAFGSISILFGGSGGSCKPTPACAEPASGGGASSAAPTFYCCSDSAAGNFCRTVESGVVCDSGTLTPNDPFCGGKCGGAVTTIPPKAPRRTVTLGVKIRESEWLSTFFDRCPAGKVMGMFGHCIALPACSGVQPETLFEDCDDGCTGKAQPLLCRTACQCACKPGAKPDAADTAAACVVQCMRTGGANTLTCGGETGDELEACCAAACIVNTCEGR